MQFPPYPFVVLRNVLHALQILRRLATKSAAPQGGSLVDSLNALLQSAGGRLRLRDVDDAIQVCGGRPRWRHCMAHDLTLGWDHDG